MSKARSAESSKAVVPPPITDAEWVVMETLWAGAPRTANEIVSELGPVTDWKPKTIHTLIRRLAEKGAVVVDRSEREHRFRPAFDGQTCRKAASRNFLARLFRGRLTPFLACLIEDDSLSKAEIEALRKLVNSNRP